ncbi:MAG: lactate racemase domain-containing protein [Planctomycetia bacterium]|nr:lactate racemase domain-containing protein [Planctomycetia bacterium]
MTWFSSTGRLGRQYVLELVHRMADEARLRFCKNPKRVLLLPPDITRAHCGAGWITEELYKVFSKKAEVHVIPTLGQHVPHTPEQNRKMFGSIPLDRIHAHDWRDGCKTIGELPAKFVKEASNGKANWSIPVSLNTFLLEGDWDLIINVGHVVPHEVLGFANHNKNYFIGLGGKPTICASHMMAACCGIENNLGCLVTPLRACYNKMEEDFLSKLPDVYFELTMAYDENGNLEHTGVFVGEDREVYMEAAKLSQKQNIKIVRPLQKVIAYMQPDEFQSTWVANKAIYRTRKAMQNGGELLIVAPGLKRFGEQPDVDALIRKYGYSGTENIMRLWKENSDLQDLTHGTAHLIHGSSEGRFHIIYVTDGLTPEEIEGVGYESRNLDETLRRYDLATLKNGYNTMPNGEVIYFINSPSTGLWSTRANMNPVE